MAVVLTMMVDLVAMVMAVTLAMALIMTFLMPLAMTMLVSVAILILLAVMMTMVMTAVMSVVVTSLLTMMMAVVMNMMIAILSLSNLRKSLGVTTIMAMFLITTINAFSVFITVTVAVTSMSIARATVLSTTLTIILNLPSPLLSLRWVVLEILTRDQRSKDEPIKGLLNTISSSTIFGTLLAHDYLERLLGFNATSKIQNKSLPHVSVQTLLNIIMCKLTRSAARKLLMAVRMGRSTSPSRYLPDSWVTFRRRITDWAYYYGC